MTGMRARAALPAATFTGGPSSGQFAIRLSRPLPG
jgi:hypothetical protein